MTEPEPIAPVASPRVLHAAWRAACGVVAVTLGTFGVLAVFHTTNDVGASVLLVVATFFAIVTVLGRVPRVKVGDNEIDPTVAEIAGAVGATSAIASELAENGDEQTSQSARAAGYDYLAALIAADPPRNLADMNRLMLRDAILRSMEGPSRG